jgi:hypothetical protein
MSKLIPLVLLLAGPAFSGTLIDASQSPVSFAVSTANSPSQISFLTEAWERLTHAFNPPATPTPEIEKAAEESLLDRLLRSSLLYS